MIARKAVFPPARATALGVATALALTALAPSIASAAPAGKGLTATSGMTDVSARRRGFNPGAAAVAGVVGTGLAIAGAAAASNAYYDDGYGYYGGGGPVYVAPGPGYYYGGGYGGGYGYRSGRPADQNGHPLASW